MCMQVHLKVFILQVACRGKRAALQIQFIATMVDCGDHLDHQAYVSNPLSI